MKKKISVFLYLTLVAIVSVLGLCGTASAITGDLDGNNYVDWNDLDTFTDRWLNTGCSAADWCGGADIDHSSKVDFNDFGLLALHWLESEFVDHNLVGWYRLDEAGGVTAYDSSEYGYDGTISGGASWEPTGGRYEGTVRLHGDDERVAIPTTGISRLRGTITLWGRLEGAQTQHYRFFFGDRTGGSDDNRIQLYMKDNTVLCTGLADNHNLNTSIMTLSTDTWYHIALTWGGGGGSGYVVYVDGDDKASGTHSAIGVLSASADIGNSGEPSPVGGFNGLIDEVGIWDRVLDAGEISDVYNNGIGEPGGEPPEQPSNPNPSDTATGLSINADLNWTAGAGAASHDVYFGTDSTPDSGEFQGNQPGTTYNPGTMGYSTTYYWRIDEKNAYGTTTGAVWSFTTESVPAPPGQASSPNPSDTATGVSISANLSWTAGSGATSHDVYFGTDSTPDAGEFQGNQPGTTYNPGIMDVNTTYYWRIDEKNAGGTTTGDVWSFTTGTAPAGPGQADMPYPSDGAAVPDVGDLEWSNVIAQPWDSPDRLDHFDDFITANGAHPRLLLTQADVNDLKSKINSGIYNDIWLVIKNKADDYLSSSPRNNPGSESDTRSDGDAVPWLAMAYLMTDNTAYLNKAVSWMTTVCNYSEWDGNGSLGAGHCLMGVSLAFDWLYNDMTPTQRNTILNGSSGTRGLIYFANQMANGSPTHKERYLANHCQVEYGGLSAAGFALYGEVTAAEGWLRKAYNIFTVLSIRCLTLPASITSHITSGWLWRCLIER